MNRVTACTGLLLISCTAVSAQGLGLDQWEKGTQDWRYRGDQFGLAVGQARVDSPLADTEVVLGGIRLDSRLRSEQPRGKSWDLSVAAGAIDQRADAGAGDLSYGPLASHARLAIQPSEQWSFVSDVQTAPGLFASSAATRFHSARLGTFGLGLGRGRQGVNQGWGYHTHYSVRLWQQLDVSWQADHRTAGYANLAGYAGGPAAGSATRQKLTAGMDFTGRGSLAGSYESVRNQAGEHRHHFGVARQVWYSPNVKVGFKAGHETSSGDYDVGLTLSFPVR